MWKYIYIYVYIYIYIGVYTYIYIYIHCIVRCVGYCGWPIDGPAGREPSTSSLGGGRWLPRICICVCMCMYVCMYIYIYTVYMYVYVFVYIHTYICMYVFSFFSRTLARKTSEVSRSDTHPYISPSAHGPVASSHNIALHRLFPGGVPLLHTAEKADTHRDNSEPEERSNTFEGTNPVSPPGRA